jgi:hypothetical protein
MGGLWGSKGRWGYSAFATKDKKKTKEE